MKNQKGITIIALIITIILMLILATISVNVAINGGLFEKASDAVDSAEIANEKDTVVKANILAKSRAQIITLEELQKALNSITGPNVTTVLENMDTFLVKFNESNRLYEIFNTGNVEYLGKLKEKPVTLECVDSTGKVVASKNLTILTDKYSITLPQIEGYEPSVEKITGEIGESETIQALYYQLFQDDTTLVFTGLDSSGNVTTDEASIVSYMVGDGSSTNGNGLLEKTVLGILKIPENYKGKPVTVIGQNAFRVVNIKIAITGDNIEKIQSRAFTSRFIEEVVIGKNVEYFEGNAFEGMSSLKTVTINTEKDGVVFNALSGIPTLTEIKVNSDNKVYKQENNILYSKDGKILYLVPGGIENKEEFVVKDGVETIWERAMYATYIKKIIISDTVKTIQSRALSSPRIEEVVIGKNVESWASNTFETSSNIKTVTIKSEKEGIVFYLLSSIKNLTEIKVNSDNKTYKQDDNILYSFDGKILYLVPGGREKDVIIPSGVETIFDCAVRGNSKINQIQIADTVNTIKANAFQNCTNLKIVIIDSATIAGQITKQTSCNYLVNAAETIYIKEGITPGSYITDTTIFKVETSDKEGYVRYVKIS